MTRLSMRLLGPFEATLDEEPVTSFDSDKVRALLAYLAVEAERPPQYDRGRVAAVYGGNALS